MKFILIACLICISTQGISQKTFDSRKEVEVFKKNNSYTATNGWTIKGGDTILLGKGSMPEKTFAFITEMPNLLTYSQYADYNKHKLQHTYNGRKAIVKEITYGGTKKGGFYVMALLKVGQGSRYVVDIENAIEAGELQVPGSSDNNPTFPEKKSSLSLADELKKLKDLLDNGALTREEYEAAKKKVLEQ